MHFIIQKSGFFVANLLFIALVKVLLPVLLTVPLRANANDNRQKVLATITAEPYSIAAYRNGDPLTDIWPFIAIHYFKDGSALITLTSNVKVKSTWQLDEPGKMMTVTSFGYAQAQWEILEITPKTFRKRNVVSGIEVIHSVK
jgi:hypothetical protein